MYRGAVLPEIYAFFWKMCILSCNKIMLFEDFWCCTKVFNDKNIKKYNLSQLTIM